MGTGPGIVEAGATPAAVDWPLIWQQSARRLRRHAEQGLSDLLTEDVLRFEAVQELVATGSSPGSIVSEWRRPPVRDAVDLVVTAPDLVAIEFKYPREPRETNAAWTQHLGESLKDFYRLACMPADVAQRWCVQLWSRRAQSYFDGVSNRSGLALGTAPGLRTYLDAAIVRSLPATATGQLQRWLPDLPPVSALCVCAERVSPDLLLLAHKVEPVGTTQPR